MSKKFISAIAVTLALGACTSSSEEAEPTPDTTSAQSSEATTSAPTEDPGETQTSEPTTSAPTSSVPDIEFTPANASSQSENWPDLSAQALAVAVDHGETSITVEYDSDGTGTLEWYTDGWVDTVYEDGSGFEIELGTERALQVWVSGVRYPEPTEDFELLEGSGGEGLILSYSVSGPFEGMHSIAIGADADLDYAIEVSEEPLAITIYVDEP